MANNKYLTPKELQKLADKARLDLIERTEGMKEPVHWGSAFSLIEIGSVLLSVTIDLNNDVFFLSKGHGAAGLYAIMHQIGMLSDADWKNYQKDGSALSELMEYNPKYGFNISGGSLGLALSYAGGVALLWKKTQKGGRVYVLMGDGEVDEGSVWEAFMSIGQFHLDNLFLLIDANGLQSDGRINDVMPQPELIPVLQKFGWDACEVDGHDCAALMEVFGQQTVARKPRAIICHTIKGKGVSFMEGEYTWHDRSMTNAEYQIAIEEAKRRVTDG